MIQRLMTIRTAIPSQIRIVVAFVLLALSIPLLILWVRWGGFGPGGDVIPMLIAGIALLILPRLLQPERPASMTSATANDGGSSIVAFGFANNLAVAQLLAVAVLFVSVMCAKIDQAWYAALITVMITPALFKTRAQLPSILMGASGLIYLAYQFYVRDFSYEITSDQYALTLPNLIIPVGKILWVMAVIALLPQLQFLLIGRLRGDFQVRLFGTSVPVSFTSSVLIVCAWNCLVLLWYAPGWVPAAFQS